MSRLALELKQLMLGAPPLTLAVAALPEEFPVVYSFFLGLGVFRLARRKALVRRAVAVENIGRVSCIVSDKTGTITEGVLVLAHRVPADGKDDVALLQAAARAARPDSGDPLDQALHALRVRHRKLPANHRAPVVGHHLHRRQRKRIEQGGQVGQQVRHGIVAHLRQLPGLAHLAEPPARIAGWRLRLR